MISLGQLKLTKLRFGYRRLNEFRLANLTRGYRRFVVTYVS